ncbi:hypothetical protein [Ensifer canadensis]
MPRTGGVYSPPAGTKGVPNTTIQSVPYNTLIDDLAADANAARPVTAGGTGATSASGARTALGVEIGTNVQAYDAGLQSIAGLVTVADQMIYTTASDVYATTALTPFARTLLDDADAATVLTTLGVSDFMKTALDDANAATARATLGADNASNLTSGTVADARLPATMAGKTFSGSVVFNGNQNSFSAASVGLELGAVGVANTPFLDFHSSASATDYDVRVMASAGTGTAGQGYLSITSTEVVLTGHLRTSNWVIANALYSKGDISINTDGNMHLWFRSSIETNNGLLYYDRGNRSLNMNLYNSSGAFVRSLSFTEAGNFTVNGSIVINGGGNLLIGSAVHQPDGNIYMPWASDYLSNVLNSKITSNGRAYPRLSGGGDFNVNWSGQPGQPSWLIGGNDGINFYVYSPSNFNVNYANSAGNADTVDGYHAIDLAQIYKGTNAPETNLPIGTTVIAYGNAVTLNHQTYAVYLRTDTSQLFTLDQAAGAQLSGTWRARGQFTYSGSNRIGLYQRVA